MDVMLYIFCAWVKLVICCDIVYFNSENYHIGALKTYIERRKN